MVSVWPYTGCPVTMAPMTAPGTLDALKAITDPEEQALAATAYIAQRREAIEHALHIRDEAIVRLLRAGHGVTAVAKVTGMSTTHVKNVQRWLLSP